MHIVHVEDEKPLKEILKVAMQAADPQINLRQFITADEAIIYMQQHLDTVDLVILDIRLPGTLDGVQAAELLRDMKYNAYIILTSAYSRPTFDVLDRLNTEFYAKPWHIIDVTTKMLQLKHALFQKRLKQSDKGTSGDSDKPSTHHDEKV
jgi:two-component SAPR family response regulator